MPDALGRMLSRRKLAILVSGALWIIRYVKRSLMATHNFYTLQAEALDSIGCEGWTNARLLFFVVSVRAPWLEPSISLKVGRANATMHLGQSFTSSPTLPTKLKR